MRRPYRFRGYSNGERVETSDRQKSLMKQQIRSLSGRQVAMTIEAWPEPVTEDARGLWWAEIVPLFQEVVGEPSAMEMHADLVKHLLGLEVDESTGDLVRPSTAQGSMFRDDFSELIFKAKAFGAAKFGMEFESDLRELRRAS